MAVNCFMCCLTSLQRAGSVRRSASRNFGVRASTASVQNFDESASRSASPPRAAASTSLRAALASGVPLAGEECLVRLVLCGGGVLGGLGVTRRAGGVIGDAIGRGLQPRRGGGEVGGLGLHRRRGGGVIGGMEGFSVRVGKRIGGSALRTRVGGCCMGIFVLSGLTRRPEMAIEFGQPQRWRLVFGCVNAMRLSYSRCFVRLYQPREPAPSAKMT